MREYKICLFIGLVLMAASWYKLKQSFDFIRNSEQVRGTVTSLVKDNDDTYSPVFTVDTKADGQIIYHHLVGSSPSAWDVGEEAAFLYKRGDPDSITMMSYFWLFSWSIILMAIALPLLILSAGYFLLRPLLTI